MSRTTKRFHTAIASFSLLALGALAGCALISSTSTTTEKTTDRPINVDLGKVTYARPRSPVPVLVKVVNPEFAYSHRYVISASLAGTSVYTSRMKFGDALKVISPLVWAKYLDVRTDAEPALPIIEMDVTDVSGEASCNISTFAPISHSFSLALTLRCRVIAADGTQVEAFSSMKQLSRPTASDGEMREVWQSPEKLLAEAFNDILQQFFSSPKVMAALSAAEGQVAAAPLPASAGRAQGALTPIRNSFALAVGIGRYQNAGKGGLTNLVYADDDARGFVAALRKQGWGEGHVKLLVNEEATEKNIRIALESWLTKAGPDDIIVLFWSGHGFPDPEDPEKVYFACYDTDVTIPATGFRMDRVRQILEERKARNVVVFADTCHAGKLITRDGDRSIGVRPYIAKMEKDKTVPKGWIFMVAADTDRQAIEHSSWSNGAFTHCLLDALSGKADGYQGLGPKDGVVTMLELRGYMTDMMPEETQRVLGVAKRPLITTSTGDSQVWNLDLRGR